MDIIGIAVPLAELVVITSTVGRAYWDAHGEEFLYNVKTYGIPEALLLQVFARAGRTVYRVKHHLLGRDDEHVILFKKSFTESFAMIGVAGAIIAQIAITGLSLNKLDETHWTAYAAFVISVIAGCLSVYYSCTMQLLLSGLHGPQEILEWLTAPKTTHRPMQPFGFRIQLFDRIRQLNARLTTMGLPKSGHIVSVLQWIYSVFPSQPTFEDIGGIPFNSPEWLERRNPSISAALLLVAPAQFLTLSLGAFLTGQGIYLGMLYGRQLNVVRGQSSAMRIMITYLVVTAFSLLIYAVILAMKTSEDWILKRQKRCEQSVELQPWQNEVNGTLEAVSGEPEVRRNRPHPTSSPTPARESSDVDAKNASQQVERLISALEVTIRAQAEQLEAHRALLNSLRGNEWQDS